MDERRAHPRRNVEIPLTQLIDDRRVEGLASDISLSGIHSCRFVGPFARSSRKIQVEITLPDGSAPLVADAEVVYDSIGPVFHETGIRFVEMPDEHRRRLTDWLESADA